MKSVPRDIKYAIRDDVLPCGTKIYAQTAVVYCPYAMGRNPRIWMDPLEFQPSRWLKKGASCKRDHFGLLVREGERNDDDKERGKAEGPQKTGLFRGQGSAISDYVYPTFNAGPRLCLGRPLAYMEMELILAMILTSFDLKPAGPLSDDYLQTIVPPLKNGLWVMVRRATGK